MNNNRPYCLSIAGFDPTAGAGVLADIKTFESFNVYGMGIITCNTYQTDNSFIGVDWIELDTILNQMKMLMTNYNYNALKIGLIKDFFTLQEIIRLAKELCPEIKIVWDPILKSSSGFNFHTKESIELRYLVESCYLITPNWDEFQQLWKINVSDLIVYRNESSVLLKGGHRTEKIGCDLLINSKKAVELQGNSFNGMSKHGTGCVLSAAITANLSQGVSLHDSCIIAKNYTEKFILSNTTNLGYHDY